MNDRSLIATALVVTAVVSASWIGAWIEHASRADAPVPAPAVSTASAAGATDVVVTGAVSGASSGGWRLVARDAAPAVVGITVRGSRAADPATDEDGRWPGRETPAAAVPFQGLGSGFVVSADGVILTSAHVVRDSREVDVRTADRREFHAKVVGTDPATDVAVLKVDAIRLPVAKLGDSRNVEVGDPVLAIGAPYGLEQTVTQGIVSAKGRALPGDSLVPFLQTDAAINPGNSGGPLLDGAGRVIGINAQIFSRNGGFQGLAFAVPIDVAMKVKDEVLRHGRVDHARLGVAAQDLGQALARAFGLRSPDGALVTAVQPGSAAASAGLQPGDVIVSMDDQSVRTAADLASRIGLARPGSTARLAVWRDGADRALAVSLSRADPEPSAGGAVRDIKARVHGPLGLALRESTAAEQRAAGIDHGLVVQAVAGRAERVGIEPGDIVLAINGRPVDSEEQLRALLDRRPAQVALLIQHGRQRLFVPIDLG